MWSTPTYTFSAFSTQKELFGFTVDLNGIVFIWSQLDGGKVEQRKMAKVPSKTL